jgi:hypothetical protein
MLFLKKKTGFKIKLKGAIFLKKQEKVHFFTQVSRKTSK